MRSANVLLKTCVLLSTGFFLRLVGCGGEVDIGFPGQGAAGNGGSDLGNGAGGAGANQGTGGLSGVTGGTGGAGGLNANSGCGDGIKDGVEQCDGTDLGGATCASVTGDPNSKGSLTCFANCALNTGQCSITQGQAGAAGAGVRCGDNVKDGKEACDGTDLGGATCASATGDPQSTGALSCFANCTLNEGACSAPPGTGGAGGGSSNNATCGDGVKDGTEKCDGADLGIATCASALGDPNSKGTLKCFANCTLNASGCTAPSSTIGGKGTNPVCGDGIKDGKEECDGVALGTVTCASATGNPKSVGAVACFANCTLNTSACTNPILSGGGAGAGGAGGGPNKECHVTKCQNHVYQCGDCIDNDGDGLVDMDDPDCLGPCSNNESGFYPNIPGGNNASNCKQDCYFDQDSGSGDDRCYWSHECDPHELLSYPEAQCSYNPKAKVPGAGGQATCGELYSSQSDQCHSFCGPLTPNGCDCFGCCDLPGGSGNFVWLGSTNAQGTHTCDIAHMADPTKCHPCEPVQGCFKACGHCELCLGKTTLPADCLPPPSGAVCGNGVKEGGEQCDEAALGGATCASITGNSSSTGSLVCLPNCTINASACVVPTTVFCGDGIREGAEQCDGTDLGSATCVSVTGIANSVGMLTCAANCTLNGSQCSVPMSSSAGAGGATGMGGSSPTGTGGAGGSRPSLVCGDGLKNGTEQCDGKDLGGATCASVTGNPNSVGTLTCAANCTINASGCSTPTGSSGAGGATSTPVCGDGLRDGTEQCDGTDLGGATCASVTGDPNSTGALACFAANCTFNTAGCTTPVGGTGGPGCGGQLCPATAQPCGLPCQPTCPSGSACITGCCATSPILR